MIVIEKAIKDRQCYDCGKLIKSGEACARIYGNTRSSRSYCTKCLVEGTVKLLKLEQVEIDKESAGLIKEYFVEKTI